MTNGVIAGVDRLDDPSFNALIPRDISGEVVADFEGPDELHWLEGPVWDRQQGCLLFSDVKANAIYRWDRDQGVRIFLQPSGYSGEEPFAGEEPGANGLALDAAGRLLICEHGDRRIRRLSFVARGRACIAPRGPPDPQRYRFVAGRGDPLPVRWGSQPIRLAGLPASQRRHPGRRAGAAGGDPARGSRRAGRPGGGSPREPLRRRPRGGLRHCRRRDAPGHPPYGCGMGAITTNLAWGEDGSTLFVTTERRLVRLRVGTRGAGW